MKKIRSKFLTPALLTILTSLLFGCGGNTDIGDLREAAQATQSIGGPPAVNVVPTRYYVEGQTLSVTSTSTKPINSKLQWYRNSTAIPGCQTSTCIIKAITPQDSGTYSIRITTSTGSTTQRIQYTIVQTLKKVFAKSCQATDVQQALNSAENFSVVNIPPGDCDWQDAPTVKRAAGVWLKGAGRDLTIIRRSAPVTMNGTNNPANHYLIEFDCTNGLGLEVSDLSLIGNDKLQNEEQRLADIDGGLNLVKGCKNFKIHDTKFNDFSYAGVAVRDGGGKGVIYASQFEGNFKCQPTPVNCLGYGVMVLGDFSWPELQLGTDIPVVMEDNFFSDNRHGVASNYGSQYVVRKNTFVAYQRGRNFAMIDAHGLGMKRGSRSWEIYQNQFIDQTIRQYNTASIGIRGGDGVVWGNIYPSSFHTAVNFFPESSCKNGDGSLRPYPMQDQTTDAWIWDNQTQTPTLAVANYYGVVAPIECANYFVKDRDYHLAPKPGYQALIYPHPLRNISWGLRGLN